MLSAAGRRAETVLIRNATVHTMGRQGVLQNTDILVSGETIKEIGQNLPMPRKARA